MPLEQYVRAYHRELRDYSLHSLKVTMLATLMVLHLATAEVRGREVDTLTHPIYHGVPL